MSNDANRLIWSDKIYGLQRHAASLVAALLLVTLTCSLYLRHVYSERPVVPPQSIYVPGYSWREAPYTLVIYVRFGCPFCKASFPFYAHLLNSTSMNRPGSVHLIFVSADDKLHARYAAPLLTPPKDVLSVPFLPSWIGGTPTICLVDNKGHVKQEWTGLLPPAIERQIEQIVNATSSIKDKD